MRYSFNGYFPSTRLRRKRQFPWIRDMVAQNSIHSSNLIQPLFIRTEDIPAEISSLPGIKRYTIDELPETIKNVEELNIPAVAIFPVISDSLKDNEGNEAFNENNLICKAIKKIKDISKNVGVVADVALDPYTPHGHDGILIDHVIDNDKTLEALEKQALCLAKSGADVVAPSDMMDGRIQVIRKALDSYGFSNVLIMSYAVKFASSFYGPFRDALGVKCLKGPSHKLTYQLDPRNEDQAMQEISQDIQEGADMVIIKPGMPYLDIMQQASSCFNIPLVAYQVSGEYAMIKAASQNGWIDENKCFLESIYAFKRAGARCIITYAATKIASLIKT